MRKLMSITLPAVLAPGNLPALCEWFDVEVTIVTESRLFDTIRNSPTYFAAEKVCRVQLISLDDLMTNRSIDYGMILTFALFRGFADLGARMTKTYLLFLNADFILSDGSFRHLGRLMREGKRVIHSPSFRVVLEDVWPWLQAHVDNASCTLSIPPREMARLALANRHRTVRARTVNQRLYYQTYMDQFYWHVDEETLIGYQWPVALVAIKPERFVSDPVMFWDFGFIPEAAPASNAHFIGDSDDFFMIEPQTRNSGQQMIRFGGATVDDIASVLSLYATEEHRRSGQQMLKIHAGDLPSILQQVVDESQSYMAQIFRSLKPTPVSHIDHPRLGEWFEETKRRRRSSIGATSDEKSAVAKRGSSAQKVSVRVLFYLQSFYRNVFGTIPKVGLFHPLWTDSFAVAREVANWRAGGEQRILWISSVNSLFDAEVAPRINPTTLLMSELSGSPSESLLYDACVCELSLSELLYLRRLYAKIRPLIRDGGKIVVSVRATKGVFDGATTVLQEADYPDLDISEICFYGTAVIALARKLAIPALRPIPTRPIVRATIVASLVLLAPLIWFANTHAARRDPSKFRATWTSLLIKFVVRRGQAAKISFS